ncbi:MAG: hypothetical protein HDT20_03960 [Oscillibacter sp.]|nr:hypothetical protein [Oscillibacter sp.]
MGLSAIQYGILGYMLVYPERVGEIMTRLTAEDFDAAPARGLFEAVSRLHFAGAPIDPVTVAREAGADYEPAVDEALRQTASDGLYYCDLLREGAQLKRIQGCAYDLAGAETMEAAGKTIDYLNSLVTLRKQTEVVTAHDAAADFIRRMSRETKPEYMSLGMPELDRLLFIEPGDFILVGGYASSGKTLLSLQFALELAKKYRVGYFSIETNTRKLTDRMIAYLAQVPLAAIKECCLDPEQARRASHAARTLDKLPLDLIHAGGMSVRDIQAITLSKRYQVIFVDYLQLTSAQGKTRYEQVTGVSIGLHTLAQSHDVAVFALAQLSRPEKTEGKKLLPPNMSSFRESGQLEQDADVAMLLWPSDPNDNKSARKLKIAKNKDGGRDTFSLDFNGATQTLSISATNGKSVPAYYAEEGRKAQQRNRKTQQSGFQPVSEDEDTPFDDKK